MVNIDINIDWDIYLTYIHTYHINKISQQIYNHIKFYNFVHFTTILVFRPPPPKKNRDGIIFLIRAIKEFHWFLQKGIVEQNILSNKGGDKQIRKFLLELKYRLMIDRYNKDSKYKIKNHKQHFHRSHDFLYRF